MAKRKKKTKVLRVEAEKRKWDNYDKVNTLSKNHNPPPARGKPSKYKNTDTVERNSNFINVAGGYFNKGKYKAINVDKAPLNYLNWVIHNIELNKSETTLIRKLIKSEMEKNQLNKTNKTTSNSSSS